MKKLFIETYGCQMNVADSEVVASVMQMAGYETTEHEEEADAIFLNTCSIRENAESKIYNRLDTLYTKGRQRKAQGGSKLLLGVLGCMAERVKDDLIANHHADIVCGPDSYLSLPDLIAQAELGHKAIDVDLSTTETYRDVIPQRIGGNRISGFVSIMRGCNNFCHYCIVPYTRGRERSRDVESILREVHDLSDRGFKEVTLLGQNVNSYGKEYDFGFAKLLSELDKIPGKYKLSFMTSHPKDCTHELIDTIADSRHISYHLHLPVQCGSDRILKEMNRHYDTAHYLELIEYAKKRIPKVALTTDIIVGFPRETYEDFLGTVELMKKVRYDSAYTFIYSKREGTKAAAMPDPISDEDKGKWFRQLLDEQNSIGEKAYERFIGDEVEVLCEGIGRTADGLMTGHSRHGVIVDFNGTRDMIGKYVTVRIQKALPWAVTGELVSVND